MEALIHCVKCSHIVEVGDDTANHDSSPMLTCQNCGHQFQRPSEEELWEETCAIWIEESVEEFEDERELETAARQHQAELETERAKQKAREEEIKKQARKNLKLKKANKHSNEQAVDEKRLIKFRALPSEQSKPQPVPDKSQVASVAAATKSIQPKTKAPASPDDSLAGMVIPSSATRKAQAANQQSLAGVPAIVQDATKQTPKLHVDKIGSTGVVFSFDQEALRSEGFRASLSIRCACNGETDARHLIARPMLFTDRLDPSHRDKAQVAQLIRSHEIREVADMHPREIVRRMGLLEHLPRPFCYAMPYYVSTGHARRTLHAKTRTRAREGAHAITCEVLIPDGPTALDWLGRVNGVCGDDYYQLEKALANMHGDVWNTMPEQIRERISVWCKLSSRETVKGYFRDADFTRHDSGMAGILITNERIVWCKYHHRGQVRLDNEDANIILTPELTPNGKSDSPESYQLRLIDEHASHRMGRLTARYVDELQRLLPQNTALHVLIREEPMSNAG